MSKKGISEVLVHENSMGAYVVDWFEDGYWAGQHELEATDRQAAYEEAARFLGVMLKDVKGIQDE